MGGRITAEGEVYTETVKSSGTLVLVSPSRDWNDYTNKQFITREMFEEILAIYENNQLYYRNANMIKELIDFEYWFMHVIEPPPSVQTEDNMKEWKSREKTKLLGYSYYCLPGLRSRINMGQRDFSSITRAVDVVVKITAS